MHKQELDLPQPNGSPSTFHLPDHTDMSSPNRQTAMTPLSSMSQPSMNEEVLYEAEAQVSEDKDGKSYSAVDEGNNKHGKGSSSIKDLHQITVNLHYGDGRNEQYMIHLEHLLRHSAYLTSLFTKAESLHRKYEIAVKMRKNAKALLPPETSTEEFWEQNAVEQAIIVINDCFEKYPLVKRRKSIRSFIAGAVDEVFHHPKGLKVPTSKGGFNRKDHPKDEVRTRLEVLTVASVHSVLIRLSQQLRIIKRLEQDDVKFDESKAAAQRQIFVSNVDACTARYFVRWIYFGELDFDNAQQLCRMHALAERLGMEDLAETCLTMLESATHTAIQIARQCGISIRTLINEKTIPVPSEEFSEIPENLRDAVTVVFSHVVQDRDASKTLRTLVITEIANSEDVDLFKELKPRLSPEMALDLAEAVFTRASKSKPETTSSDQGGYHMNEV